MYRFVGLAVLVVCHYAINDSQPPLILQKASTKRSFLLKKTTKRLQNKAFTVCSKPLRQKLVQ